MEATGQSTPKCIDGAVVAEGGADQTITPSARSAPATAGSPRGAGHQNMLLCYLRRRNSGVESVIQRATGL